MKRLKKVKIIWSPQFAYAIGLIATDGNLSSDMRHINMTSKDREIIIAFKNCLGIENKIGRKARGGSGDKKYFVVQFGDKNLYDFLLDLGLKPAKSKTLGTLAIPKKYFADFLRGCIDGDGNIDVHSHPESQHPQLKVRLSSASVNFLKWVKKEIYNQIKPAGGWIERYDAICVLSYAKSDSIKLLKFIYYKGVKDCLCRKYEIAKKFLNENE